MAIVTAPTYPIAGTSTALAAHWSDTSGEYAGDVTHEITSVPPGSATPLGLLGGLPGESARELALREYENQFRLGSVSIYSANRVAERSLTFDAAGDYGITTRYWRVQHMANVDPSYSFQESGHQWHAQQAAEQSATVSVGAVSTLRIESALGEGATLSLTIVGDTVRAASWSAVSSERVQLAVSGSAVEAARAALIGVAVASLGPDLVTVTNELLTAHNRHVELVLGDVHDAADTASKVVSTGAGSPAGAIGLLNLLRAAQLRHMTASSAAAAPWHIADDLARLPVAGPARDMAGAQVLCADLRNRCYSPHIADGDAHDSPDATNTLATAATPLEGVIVALLGEVADLNASALATGVAQGIADAADRYGLVATG